MGNTRRVRRENPPQAAPRCRGLEAVVRGEQIAAEHLLPLVYEELRRLAAARLAAESSGQTLQATALVHEAYLRLVGSDSLASRNNLADAYLAAGQFAQAESLLRKDLARSRKDPGPDHPQTARVMAALGHTMLAQRHWTEAEPVLRECLRVREQTQPGDWTTFYTRSLLGECLLGERKYDEAEALVLAGYEGMKTRESTIAKMSRPRLAEAALRVVRLYEAWGKPEEAAQWRKTIAAGAPALPELPADVFAPR